MLQVRSYHVVLQDIGHKLSDSSLLSPTGLVDESQNVAQVASDPPWVSLPQLQ